MTVLEVIQRSTDYLGKHGVESPRLQIELLLAHVLKVPRLNLYLNFDRTLTADELTAARGLVQRRGAREPLQHLVGTTSFCGLELAVDRHVLIPRPETEALAEQAWQCLNQVAANSTPAPAALDFGTGSGCLAVALAVKCPPARVSALDLSPEALAVARENARRHGVEGRIDFFEGDGFAALPGAGQFDLIVANPPYIPSGDIAGLDPEVRDHDPRLALDGGADGLDFFRRLAVEAPRRLKPAARLMAEFGDSQAEPLRALFASHGWRIAAVADDLNGRPRILVASVGQS